MSLIKLRNVNKIYKNGTVAINNISLNIEKGQFVFIIGSTGCGKSTLIKMLYREERPTNGKIIIGGINVDRIRNRKVYKFRRKIGVVFQDYHLLPNATAYENIAFAVEIFGLPKDEIHTKVMKVLELVGLKDKARQKPNQLSGGEQQRVAIARAIVNGPKILICDEPTGNLDPKKSLEIMEVLQAINQLGTTVVMVTHDIDIVKKLKERTIVLEEGRIKKDYQKGEFKVEKA